MSAALQPSFGRPQAPPLFAGRGFSAPFEADDPDLVMDWHDFEPVAAPPPLPALKEHHKHLDHVPDEPLGALPRAATRLRENWKLAVAASLVLHACAALFLLVTPPETAEIAGEDSAGIAFLGNASEDQLSSGDLAEKDIPDSVEVTMIQMLDAKPVETVDAETVPVDSSADAVETVVAESPVTETITPVDDAAVQPVTAIQAVQPTPETLKPAPSESPPTVAAATLAPEILAVETLKPVTDETIVQPAMTPVEAIEVEPLTSVEASQAVQPEPEPLAKPAAPEVLKPVPEEEKAAPKPVEKKAVEQPKKAPPKKTAAQPAPKKEQAAKAGAGGSNQTDARKGQAEGQLDGSSVAKSKGGARNGQVGNAAVSNYPGKVRSKLARTFRAPRVRAGGEVVVAFSVSANGGVRSARVVNSSGQAEIDKAALDAIRRASPFPPIPAGSGRSSWDFKIPLSVRR